MVATDKLILIFILFVNILFSKNIIKFGFTAVVAKEDVRSVELLLDYLSRKTGYKFIPVFAKT